MPKKTPDRAKRATLSPETLTAQALGRVDPATRAIVSAVHPSTTFVRDADGGFSSGRGYTRPHNPTYDEPEDLLQTLEGGRDCLLFASGMAAATAVFQSLLPRDHVVVPRVMYWALRTWLTDFALSWHLDVEFVDTSDLSALAAAIRPGKTRLIWIETPANPTWELTDIAAAAEIAHKAYAQLAVDSTVATPVLTRPIEFGADLVVHSATKYLNGHSDVLAGAIVTAQEDSLWQRIRACRRDGGAVLGPFEAWLLQRGMRTLFVRVQRCMRSALTIAEHFEHHPRVSRVLYPGLASHPGHDVAARQMSGGFGGMLSLRIDGGEAAAVETAAQVEVFKRATSLGGVESLIEHRASIEGPSTSVPLDLLRLSIGLESPDDLIADLEQALPRSISQPSAASPKPRPPQGACEEADGVVGAIENVLKERVRLQVADRGGELQLHSFEAGVLTLEVLGSPGATLPIKEEIAATIRHYVAEVTDVRLMIGRDQGRAEHSLVDRVTAIVEDQINPAVSRHGGRVALVGVEDKVAKLRFEGGCQGCAMADVTFRQGVEVMVREQAPEIVAVVDVTDHASGAKPYFKTKKGVA